MRPIDADELRKHKVYSKEQHEFVVPLYNIVNAPTVENITIFAELGEDILAKVRPQGKWIYEEGWNAYCSNCSVPTKRETNFCPYCGADMKKGIE